MAIELNNFVNPNGFSVLVNFPKKLKELPKMEGVSFICNEFLFLEKSVFSYLKELTKQSDERILKSLQLVKLKSSLAHVSLNQLTLSEIKRVQLSLSLLNQSKMLVLEHFFEGLIFSEREYFKRFFRNLIHKQGIFVLLLENDMNFVCETVKQFYLFTTKEKYKLCTDFYDEDIYKYVEMPFTVELIKYFLSHHHEVDHEITFNETLKAIYRGVS